MAEVSMNELACHLEQLVDRHSLCTVLRALEVVCNAKAEHVAANWQDRALARQWERAGRCCDRAANRIPHPL